MIPAFSKDMVDLLTGLKQALEEIKKDYRNDQQRHNDQANLIPAAEATGAIRSTQVIIMVVETAIEDMKQKLILADQVRNPIDKDYLRLMAEQLKSKLPDNFGFLLLAAPFGDNPGRLVYTSTLERKDALNLLKEFLLRNDAAEDWMKHTP